MNGEIEPIIAKTNEQVYTWGEWMSPAQLLSRSLGHPQMDDRIGTTEHLPEKIANKQLDRYENGWWFGTGDPEFWKLQDKLLIPGGKLLDLGLGSGRTAIPFAMQGMNVVGYESDPDQLKVVNLIISAYPFLPIEVRQEDMITADLGQNEYDTVILGQILGHLSSVEEALTVIDKATAALKPGGHLWIRTIGKEDEMYEELTYSSEVKQIDDNVFEIVANHPGHDHHHGNGRFLFFGQTDLMLYLAQKGLTLAHSQTIPDEREVNIMYGQDWRKDRVFGRSGMITLIAQKPS